MGGELLATSRLEKLDALRRSLSAVIRGKDETIEILLIALLAGGSVLMEDVPGVGKTTLAKALARSLDAEFRRVQFTPDLLPSDILGSSVYSPKDGSFTFKKGPIFCSILLADEINRASPRTQSALLESMSEGQATIEGVRHHLPSPFLVLATQNPVDFHGTYPLPEAQLDRFLVQLHVGYPEPDMEIEMLYDRAVTLPINSVEVVMTMAEVTEIQKSVREVQMERSLARYLVDLVAETRTHPMLKLGVSPRGSLMFFRAVQAAAYLAGRDFVIPDDIQKMAQHVLPHRLSLTPKARYGSLTRLQVVQQIVSEVPVPV
ncbi:AAA family ATPase [Thalassoglobus polymorphus]|uniref:ATPase RavA n=1 Tax=Thalassoglobus polymorphus TaxID=2527994 RepID=A0A517QH92_9PLAN|nr:MoxR family ATPase [Thalassoglobus polymorphus]QDT31004.1 ATPase RavA [Thalassoglobus polymorphus]